VNASTRISWSLIICMIGAFGAGCASATIDDHTEALAKLRDTQARSQSADCELTLMLVAHPPPAAPRDDRRAFHTEESCIKRPGEPIAIRGKLDLVFAKDQGIWRDNWRLCADSARAEGEVFRCTWDHGFRDGFPMDFVLRNPSGSPLADVLSSARVYLNGALVAALGASALQGHIAVIDGERLRRSRMPFDAPLSLRLLPAATPPPEAILTATSSRIERLGRQLKGGVTDAAKKALPSLGCTTQLLEAMVSFVATITDRPLSLGLPNGLACDDETLQESVTKATKVLHDLAEDVAAIAPNPSEAAKKLARSTLETIQNAEVGSIAETVRTLRVVVKKALASAEADANLVVEAVDDCLDALGKDVEALPERVVATVKTLRSSPKAQADLYRNIVETIASAPPEGLTSNPALLENETELKMHYRDYC